MLNAPCAASSVDAERSFSTGRLKLNHLQHNKSSETFRAQMCLNSWDGGPFFPTLEDLGCVLEEHAKSKKKKAADEGSSAADGGSSAAAAGTSAAAAGTSAAAAGRSAADEGNSAAPEVVDMTAEE